jgi:exosortase/archaeosortase family protein
MKKETLQKYFRNNRLVILFLLRIALLLIAGSIILTILRNSPGVKLRIANSTPFFFYSKSFIIICHKLLSLFSLENVYYLRSQVSGEYFFEICMPGNKCLYLGWPCYGVKITLVFIILILSFPGRNWHAAWFIPAGILLIQFFNILRFTILAIVLYYNPVSSVTNFRFLNIGIGYHELFNFVMYIFIFLLFTVWVRRYSILTRRKPTTSSDN